MMNKLILLFFLLTSSTLIGQEIGSVKNKNHSIKLLKTPSTYSLIYSDINSSDDNIINFQIKETVYDIIMEGFKKNHNHLVIVKTTNETIVKFEFQEINGVKMIKIKQNNLPTNTFGASSFFSKPDMIALFGNP